MSHCQASAKKAAEPCFIKVVESCKSPSWRLNGYIVAITKRVKGEYTEEFQDRWAAFIKPE